jgi:hypothetical protein
MVKYLSTATTLNANRGQRLRVDSRCYLFGAVGLVQEFN